MEYKVCLSCYEIFNPYQVRQMAFCPILGCKGSVLVEIDDLMMETIIVLNKKGYMTMFCCSSHLPEYRHPDFHQGAIKHRVYIDFIPQIEQEIKQLVTDKFEFLPIGEVSTHHNPFCGVIHKMPKDIHERSILEKMDYIIRANKDFYEWATSLPKLEKEIVFEEPKFKVGEINRDSQQFKDIQKQLEEDED